MSTTTSPQTPLIPWDFEVPDFEQESLTLIKGAKIVPEKLVLDMGEAPMTETSPLPEKPVEEEPVIVVIKTKVHTKQTKKKGLF